MKHTKLCYCERDDKQLTCADVPHGRVVNVNNDKQIILPDSSIKKCIRLQTALIKWKADQLMNNKCSI